MSYKYQIGCGDYSGSEAFQLEHDERYTNEELTTMIGKAALEILANEVEQRRLPRNFQDIQRDIITWLVENKGFCKIEYEVNWWVDGSDSIFDKTKWYDQEDDNHNLGNIVGMINAAGYDRTDDGYLLGRDVRTYLLDEAPQTVEAAKQMIVDKFCTDKLSYEDIMARTTLNLEIIVSVCREHKDDKDS